MFFFSTAAAATQGNKHCVKGSLFWHSGCANSMRSFFWRRTIKWEKKIRGKSMLHARANQPAFFWVPEHTCTVSDSLTCLLADLSGGFQLNISFFPPTLAEDRKEIKTNSKSGRFQRWQETLVCLVSSPPSPSSGMWQPASMLIRSRVVSLLLPPVEPGCKEEEEEEATAVGEGGWGRRRHVCVCVCACMEGKRGRKRAGSLNGQGISSASYTAVLWTIF